MISAEELRKYALVDWKKAKLRDLTKADRTPQFEQDKKNCWFYSMCNNAYYNLQDFKLGDLIDVKVEMRNDWIKIAEWWNPLLSWWYIARYLTKKLKKEIRVFNISFYETKKFCDLLKMWYCFEMTRISSPELYKDNDDDWIINKIHYYWEQTGLHSTNICFDRDKKMIKELWTYWSSKHNIMLYNVLKFWECIKTRAIESSFYFLAEMKDE